METDQPESTASAPAVDSALLDLGNDGESEGLQVQPRGDRRRRVEGEALHGECEGERSKGRNNPRRCGG